MTVPTITAVSPGDHRIPGMAEVPPVTGTSRVPETGGTATNATASPWEPGDLCVHHGRLKAVGFVTAINPDAGDDYLRWLVAADGPGDDLRWHDSAELRHPVPADLARDPQRTAALIRDYGAHPLATVTPIREG